MKGRQAEQRQEKPLRGAEAKTAWSGEGWMVKVGLGRAEFRRSGPDWDDSDDSQRREAGWDCFGWLPFAGSFVPGKLGLG